MKVKFIFLVALGVLFVSCKTTEKAAQTAVQPAAKSKGTETVQKIEIAEDAEYSRSVSALSGTKVSYDDFQRDKAAILTVIADLDKSMKNRDYNLWRSYLTPGSISYWNNKFNLQVIATKLPKKGLTLRNLGDYFTHVFIPSRIDRKVNEIRYIAPSEVKAVEVQDNKDIIYYEFEKIDGRWLVKLPTL
ncbi:hypothetical protein H0R92_00220 [Treponema sp. OMZ 840]|uniref:hypothetical protein n=1 Tax=Treponema sp. OMZ 840 TaxID=244313 RepID=UPI003D8C1530